MNYIQNISKNYILIFFVLLAFFVMVVCSYYFVNGITQPRMKEYGDQLMNTAELSIREILLNNEMVLNSAYLNVNNMINDKTATTDTIIAKLKETFQAMVASNERFVNTRNVYGLFREEWFDSVGYVLEPDFVPKKRPWYIAAINNPNNFAYCDPYIDVVTKNYVVSVSRELFDAQNTSVGVMGTDIYMTDVANYVNSIKVTNGGYGILLNAQLDVLNVSNTNLAGHNLLKKDNIITESLVAVGKALLQETSVSAMQFTDANGEKHVVFFRRLFNGWYVGGICPLNSYNQQLYEMTLILSILGASLAAVLSFVLIRFATERDRLDEVNKLKSSFLANMSHEIRTPMNAILGMSEIVLRDPLPQEAKNKILRIRDASQSLLSIINDILDFSKIEAGKLEFIHTEYKLSSVINDVFTMIVMRIGEKPITLSVFVDPDIPEKLIGDAIRIKQILINLLGNAVKFTNKGSVTLEIHAKARHDDQLLLHIMVTDTGIGIKEEDLEKLFSSFSQVDMKRNKMMEGTGLGLVICKNLAAMMQGTIGVTSEYGKGSTFCIEIMQTISDPAPIGTYTPHEHTYTDSLDQWLHVTFTAPEAKLLFVDDNLTNLEVIKGFVKPYGCQIMTASSAQECLNLLRTKRFHIIFMDHMMPIMDGMEATGIIRKTDTQTPVIMLTANAISGMRSMYLESGFNDYLSKPIDIKELDRVLREFLPKEYMKKIKGRPVAQTKKLPEAVIRTMYLEGQHKIPLLQKYFYEKNLALYSIEVHALRAVAATLTQSGVSDQSELGDLAKLHEHAAKSGDYAAVQESFERLISLYQSFVSDLTPVTEKKDTNTVKTVQTRADIDSLFTGIQSCCECYDIDGITEAIARLNATALSEQEEIIVQNMATAAELVDYDAVVACVSQYYMRAEHPE